jgi:hypothetical protein
MFLHSSLCDLLAARAIAKKAQLNHIPLRYQLPVQYNQTQVPKHATLVKLSKNRTSRSSGVSLREIRLGGG